MPSQNVEEYIEAIYRLGGEGGAVSTCDLADHLGVAPPSVTTMVRRLSRDGLVKHVRYYGASLTETGLQMALDTIRRHRLSERLLTDVLGIPLERVHAAACKLEHVITGEVEESAYRVLGEPERCPHGHLLVGDEEHCLERLADVAPGDTVMVVKLGSETEDFLLSASDRGLIPCAELLVESSDDSSVHIVLDDLHLAVDKSLAADVWVVVRKSDDPS